METVIFYEKPGCINNTRQKQVLEAAGHCVIAVNLLEEPWTSDRLLPFLQAHPVAEWFNRSAPAIKSGDIIPETLEAQTALQLLIAHPLLIRRPLLQVGDRYEVGFDIPTIAAWIGLTPIRESQSVAALKQQDLQTCPHTAK